MSLRVVFDTNIFISAFVIPSSKAEEAYLHSLTGDFILCSSVAILSETAQKLREKFGWEENKITHLLKATARVATIIKTRPHLHFLADEPDNRILECAVAAEADFVVTGDKHLLSLKHFRNISIVKLSHFLEFLKNKDIWGKNKRDIMLVQNKIFTAESPRTQRRSFFIWRRDTAK